MNERQRQLEELFHAATQLPAGERGRFLDRTCAPEMRQELEELLSEDEEGTRGLLATPVPQLVNGAAGTTGIPDRIGRYRVIRLIGEGGMGRVYEAEQESPRRTVALKVVQPGLASSAALKRFELEAEILAQLNHPGIAQIFEAGSAGGQTGSATPFLAMELVIGQPLNSFAQQRNPDTRGRLKLLATICDAVHHAHQRGVIHRDLKPANILVTPDGQPKVLDFGIARLSAGNAAGQTATLAAATGAAAPTSPGKSVRTEAGQIVGTIAYMSPEQLEGDAARIDTRSDVYALGVIGYELLGERPPFDLRTKPLAEAARIVRDQEPTRLGATAFGRPALRGDIETIIAKAMEKERERRYGSAAELAADIRRHLSHEPIMARPASAFYQISRFARRNRGLVTGFAAAIGAIVIGAAYAAYSALKQAELRVVAEQATETSKESELQARAAARRANLSAALADFSGVNAASARERLAAIAPADRHFDWRFLSRLSDSSVASLEVPGYSVGVFLPTRPGASGPTVIVVPISGKGVRRWEPLGAGKVELGDWGQTDQVGSSSDGRVILQQRGTSVVGRDSTTGGQLWVVEGAHIAKHAVASPDGKGVVIGLEGSDAASLRDPWSGEEIRRYAFEDLSLRAPHFGRIALGQAPEEPVSLIANSADATVAVDPETGRVRARLPFLNFFPNLNGSVGVAESRYGDVVFNLKTGFSTTCNEDTSVTIEPLGHLGAVGHANGSIRLIDLATGLLIAPLHGHAFTPTWMVFSIDGRWLFTADEHSARVWDTAAAVQPRVVERIMYGVDRIGASAINANGTRTVGSGWGSMMMWDCLAGAERWSVNIATREGAARLTFSRDDSLVVGAGWSNSVVALDAHDGRIVWHRNDMADPRSVTCGEGVIYVGLADGRVLVLDMGTGATVREATVSTAGVCALNYSPGAGLLAADDRGYVRRLDDRTLQPGEPVQVGDSPIRCINANESGSLVAIGLDRGGVKLLDGAALRGSGSKRAGQSLLRSSAAIQTTITGVNFDPESQQLAAASLDGLVRLFDPASMKETLTLQSGASNLLAIRLNTDRLVASGSTPVVIFDAKISAAELDDFARAKRIRPIVSSLFLEHRTSEAVVRAVDGSPVLSETDKPLARAIARNIGDHLNSFNSLAWGDIRPTGISRHRVQAAVERAEYACRAAPTNANFLNTLGVGYFRLGRYREAIAQLKRSDEAGVRQWKDGHAINALFIGRSYQELGDAAHAGEWMARARTLFAEPSFANDADTRALFAEIAPPAGTPPK